MGADDLLLLAQRAASECPRWTRAVEDQSAPIPRKLRASLVGDFRRMRVDRLALSELLRLPASRMFWCRECQVANVIAYRCSHPWFLLCRAIPFVRPLPRPLHQPVCFAVITRTAVILFPPFSLRLGWKGCGVRCSPWRLPYFSG